MTTLHDRLADLADTAPPGAPEPDLWERGRRYGRRRRVGALVAGATAVVMLGLVLSLAWRPWTQHEVRPAGSPAGLPDRIHTPPRWLPGTHDDGPVGPVAALVSAERAGWFGSATGLVGISAETGEYRFLDLPERQEDEPVALAPDGRHLAYWLEAEGDEVAEDGVAGVALYDTVTGEVERYDVESEHGLRADGLAWFDRERVVAGYSRVTGPPEDPDYSLAMAEPVVVVRVGADAPAPLDQPSLTGWDLLGDPVVVAGRLLISDQRRSSYRVLDADGGRSETYASRRTWSVGPVVGPDGDRVAGVRGNRTPGPLVAGRLVPGAGDEKGRLAVADLPVSRRVYRVLGWADERHVVTEELAGPLGRAGSRVVVRSTDVETGVAVELSRLPEEWTDVWFATDLLGLPPVPSVEPATPADPRLVAFLSLVALLTSGSAYLLWRRRVRP